MGQRCGAFSESEARSRKWQPILIYFVTFITFMAMSLFSPLVNKQLKEFKLSPFTVGIVGSAFGVTQLITQPFLPQCREKYGSKQIYVIAMLMTAMSHFLQGLARSPAVYVAARSTTGLWKHTTALGKSMLIDIVERDEIPYAVGYYITCTHLGVIFGPILGGYFIESQNGGYLICFTAAIIYLLSFAVIKSMSTVKSIHTTEANNNTTDENKITISEKISTVLGISDKVTIAKLILTFSVISSNQSIRATFPLIMIGKYGVSLSTISYLNSIQSLTSVLVGLLVRPIITRIYNHDYRKVFIHAGLIYTASFVGQVMSPNFLLAGLSVLLLESSLSFLQVTVVGITLQNCGNIGSIMMAKEMVGNLALILGPACAGAAQNISTFGLSGAPCLGALISFIGVLCATFSIPSKIKVN